MTQFHVTKSGKTEPCGATVRDCPLGEANHFGSSEEAARAVVLKAMKHDDPTDEAAVEEKLPKITTPDSKRRWVRRDELTPLIGKTVIVHDADDGDFSIVVGDVRGTGEGAPHKTLNTEEETMRKYPPMVRDRYSEAWVPFSAVIDVERDNATSL